MNRLRELAQQHNVEAIDLKFCDLSGRWRHVTMTAHALDDGLCEKGVGFDGSSLPGFTKLEGGDLCIIPDPETAFLDPFWEKPTLSLICDIIEADTKAPFARDPRGIVRKAAAYLQQTGIGTHSIWGPEHEFFLFDSINVVDTPTRTLAEINIEPPERRAIKVHGNCYHGQPPTDRDHLFRAQVVAELEKIGIKIKYHHHEVSALGQNEIEMARVPELKAADATMIIKYFVRMLAPRYGRVATFMPKPIYGEAGSGMHFHQQLMKGDQPLFYGKGYAGLSKLALSYIAGLLEHGPTLTALCNPSLNSFKRLVPGYEAPVNLFFSLANRSAAIRVPKYAVEPLAKRIEYRPPDGTCNPYLAIAAMLMAGLDGIRRKLDPTKLGFGPIDEDVFKWSPEKLASIRPLPASLPAAFAALEQDHDFLLAGNVFTEEMLTAFVEYKKKTELEPIALKPHPLEYQFYFDL